MDKKLLPLFLALLLTLPLQALAWSFPIPEATMEDPKGYLRLVNNYNLLDKTYVPEDLVKVTLRKTSSSTMQLRAGVHEALERMFADAQEQGITLYVESAYRTYRTQEVQHYNRVKAMGYDDGYVMQAGASEHQSGMAVDVVSKEWADKSLNYRFGETKEAQWMLANCAAYGFILRYPLEKKEITEVNYEPWHLRYVGVEAAGYIMDNGLVLEEFIEEWLDFQETGVWAGESAFIVEEDTSSWIIQVVDGD